MSSFTEQQSLSVEPIHVLFQIADEVYSKFIENGHETMQQFDEAVAVVMNTCKAVEALGCFSKNEDIDDVHTNSIKYLYLPYYLGKMYSLSNIHETVIRLDHLHHAKSYFQQFIDICDTMKLLFRDDIRPIQHELDINPEFRRQRKIAKYRRQKEMMQRIQVLKRIISLNKGSQNNEQEEGTQYYDNEEEVRTIFILQLKSYGDDAMDALKLVDEEIMLLNYKSETFAQDYEFRLQQQRQQEATARANDNRMDVASSHNSSSNNPPLSFQYSGGPTIAVGTGPFAHSEGLNVTKLRKVGDTIIMSRETIRGEVFRDRLAPPTMSLEEYGDLQLQEALEREERENENKVEDTRRYTDLERDGEEDNSTLVDEATMRDRDWDAFKEANPKGWGNKMGKRF